MAVEDEPVRDVFTPPLARAAVGRARRPHTHAHCSLLQAVKRIKGFSLEAALRLIRETLINKVGGSLRSVEKIFKIFDADGSGEVDEHEFFLVLARECGLEFDKKLSAEIMVSTTACATTSLR